MPNLSLRFRNTRGQYSLNLKWLGMFSLFIHKHEKTQTTVSTQITKLKNWWGLTCWRGGCPLWFWNRPWSHLAWAWWVSEHDLTHLSVKKEIKKVLKYLKTIWVELQMTVLEDVIFHISITWWSIGVRWQQSYCCITGCCSILKIRLLLIFKHIGPAM